MPANRESNSHFDEKAGVAECKTPWGRWYQASYSQLLLAASKFCPPKRIHHCKIDGEFESSKNLTMPIKQRINTISKTLNDLCVLQAQHPLSRIEFYSHSVSSFLKRIDFEFQTVGEVVVEVDLEKGTRAKECRINILPNQLTCVVRDKTLFNVSQQ